MYNANMDKKLMYNLIIRLYAEEKCFGPGVAQLLHCVKRLHSLRAAAMEMDMAYSKAWKVIRRAEEQLGFSLLHSVTGGKGGGGAALTNDAERLLHAYDDFCTEMRAYGDKLFAEKFDDWEVGRR